MELTLERKQTAFRLPVQLLEGLKIEAAKQRRSLNNYVEGILLDALYGHTPNEETRRAIEEAGKGDGKPVDLSSMEAFLKSMED